MEESGQPRSQRPLRVTMVIQRFRPYFSGQGVQLEALSRALARRGVEVTIVTAIRGDDGPARESADGYRVRRLRSDLVGGPLRRRAFAPTFAARAGFDLWARRADVDVIHVHGVNDALYAAWAFGRARGVPVVLELTLTGADDPRAVAESRNLLTSLRYAIYRRMDGYVAISPQLATALLAAGPPGAPLRTIPQGVDPERFAPASDRARVRRELGLADGPLCVFLGSLVERKGIDLVLAAWGAIAAARPDARLLLVGRDRFDAGGGDEAFLARALDALPAAARERVIRGGLRDDPERVLAASDVFLFPSRREGFGTAIIEAMACGLPCVVAELPGITDFIFAAPSRAPASTGATDGIVIAQDDSAALARAALALLADEPTARAIGAAARARVERRFAIDAVAAEYLTLYGELLAARPRGAVAA